MGAKDVVRALLDRMPDDCTLDEIIDRLYEVETTDEKEDEALTGAERAELDRRLTAHLHDPERTIDWADLRRELEREE